MIRLRTLWQPHRGNAVLLLGLLALVLVVSLQAACGHGAKGCAIVDVAHDACSVVRYLGPDGKTEELTAKDLEQTAAAKRAARGASPSPTGGSGGR